MTLPLKEFELLELLLANAGRVLPRDTLIDRVWGTDYVGDTKTLDVHVKRLRAKVEADPSTPTRIVTIRGLGYKYDDAARLTRVTPGPVVTPAGLVDRAVGAARTMARDVDPPTGWQPLGQPKHAGGRRRLRRLALHPAGPHPRCSVAAGDTLVTLALANSLFFDLDPNAARCEGRRSTSRSRWRRSRWWRRSSARRSTGSQGGRRLMVIGANALRARSSAS